MAEGYELEDGTDAEAVLANAHRLATGQELQGFMTAGYLDTRVHAL
jgi:acetylornithine deacetylase